MPDGSNSRDTQGAMHAAGTTGIGVGRDRSLIVRAPPSTSVSLGPRRVRRPRPTGLRRSDEPLVPSEQ